MVSFILLHVWRHMCLSFRAVLCLHVYIYLFSPNMITEIKSNVRPEWETCGSLSLSKEKVYEWWACWRRREFSSWHIRWLSHFQHAHWLSLPAGSLILSTISPHYWQKQQSQLIVALHTVGSINLSAWQQHPIAHWDTPPVWPGISYFSGSRLTDCISERPWWWPPELETDCLGVWECKINLIQRTTSREDIKAAVNKTFNSTDQTAYCVAEWKCKSSKHQWMLSLTACCRNEKKRSAIESSAEYYELYKAYGVICKIKLCAESTQNSQLLLKSCSYRNTSQTHDTLGRVVMGFQLIEQSDEVNGIIEQLMEGGINWINAQRHKLELSRSKW